MARHHVHLSAEIDTARRVGQRRGKPLILAVDADALHQAGEPFFLSANGVWLVGKVPPEFLRLLD
jgi:putative RNA 2'-phosphotransferase